MQHKATQPLNPAAVQAANRALYSKHPHLVANGTGRQLSATGANDRALRGEWMALYMQAGGRAEPIGPTTVGKTGSEVAAAAFQSKPPDSPTASCPASPETVAPPHGTIPPIARPLPPQAEGEAPCELIDASFLCSHGRRAGPERVLMVVPSTARSENRTGQALEAAEHVFTGKLKPTETITATLSMKGGCGSHPTWTHGPAPHGEGRSNGFEFKAEAKASIRDALNWWQVNPVTTRVAASACSGVSGSVDIRAYPPGKLTLGGGAEFSWTFYPESSFEGESEIYHAYEHEHVSSDKMKTDLLSFVDGVAGEIVKKFIGSGQEDDDDTLYPSYPKPEDDHSPKKETSECKISVGLAASGEWEWKEDKNSWKAYCDSNIKVGASPLIGLSGEFPLYAVPIPPKLYRWVQLGLFGKISGKVDLSADRKAKYWPHDQSEFVSQWTATGDGQIEVMVRAKAHLVSKDFVSGSADGKTGYKVEARKAAEGTSRVEFQGKWTGLNVVLTGEAVFGLFSYEKDFVLLRESELHKLFDWDLV